MKSWALLAGFCLALNLGSAPLAAQPEGNQPNVPALDPPNYLPTGDKDALPFELPTVPPVETVSSPVGATVGVASLTFSGNTVFSSEELSRFAAPFLAHPMGVADIEMLRQDLSRYYIDRGFVNSGVVFDEPALEGNTLRFRVIEGRLTQLQLNGLSGLDQRYLSERIVRPADGPLNMQRLRERFQFFLEDPLFDRLNARLMPGMNPGEAVLDLQVQRARPYQFSMFAHNARPPSISAEAVGVAGWVRNLTGRGDLLQASLETADDGDAINRHNISWSVPLNFHGTEIHARWDLSDSVLVEPPLDELDIESELETLEFGVSHTFIESLRHRLTLGLDYVEKKNQTKLLGAAFSFIANEPSGETRADSWRAWQEYSHRTEKRVLALRSSFAWTDTNLTDPEFNAPMIRYPDRDYRFWLGQFHYAQRLTQSGLQLVLRSTVQVTGDKLLALDGLAIGGSYSVRGYRENQLIRDNGFVLNVELEYPLWTMDSSTGELILVPFFDYGRAENTDESADEISSLGIALRYRYRGLAVDVSIAEKIDHPDFIDDQSGDLQDDGFHFRISYDLF